MVFLLVFLGSSGFPLVFSSVDGTNSYQLVQDVATIHSMFFLWFSYGFLEVSYDFLGGPMVFL